MYKKRELCFNKINIQKERINLMGRQMSKSVKNQNNFCFASWGDESGI